MYGTRYPVQRVDPNCEAVSHMWRAPGQRRHGAVEAPGGRPTRVPRALPLRRSTRLVEVGRPTRRRVGALPASATRQTLTSPNSAHSQVPRPSPPVWASVSFSVIHSRSEETRSRLRIGGQPLMNACERPLSPAQQGTNRLGKRVGDNPSQVRHVASASPAAGPQQRSGL